MPNATKSDEVRAMELQRQLEGNRELVAQQAPSSTSSDKLEAKQVIEEARCRKCGQPFERAVVVVGPARLGPHVCPACEVPEDAQPTLVPKAPEDVRDWLFSCGVNTRKHGHATIENFDASDAPKARHAADLFVVDVVAARRHDRVRGLYLTGSTGTGKSHLAVAIMRAVHEARPDVSVIYAPADRLITKIQGTYSSGGTDALIESWRDAGLAILDDLGREKDSVDALRTLCTILDEREGAPTVITSNHPPHVLGERHAGGDLWGRVASRLGDQVYRYVGVEGRDRRFAA